MFCLLEFVASKVLHNLLLKITFLCFYFYILWLGQWTFLNVHENNGRQLLQFSLEFDLNMGKHITISRPRTLGHMPLFYLYFPPACDRISLVDGTALKFVTFVQDAKPKWKSGINCFTSVCSLSLWFWGLVGLVGIEDNASWTGKTGVFIQVIEYMKQYWPRHFWQLCALL